MSSPRFAPGQRVLIMGHVRGAFEGTPPPMASGLGRIVEDVPPVPIPSTDDHLYTVELDSGHRRSAGTARLVEVPHAS
jgi:hypothetical protein